MSKWPGWSHFRGRWQPIGIHKGSSLQTKKVDQVWSSGKGKRGELRGVFNQLFVEITICLLV